MNLALRLSTLMHKLLMMLGVSPGNVHRYRDGILVALAGVAFLGSQVPVTELMSGGQPTPAQWGGGVLLILAGASAALVSPCWNVVLAGAWMVVGLRWLWTAAAGGSIRATIPVAVTAGVVWFVLKLGPRDVDWDEVPQAVSPARAVAVLPRVGHILKILAPVPGLWFLFQALFIRVGVLSRFYPEGAWAHAFAMVLMVTASAIFGFGPVRVGLLKLAAVMLILWGVGMALGGAAIAR